LTSPPGSALLDKGIIRRVYEARVRLALGHPPTVLQAEAANVYARLRSLDVRLYITLQTAHILQGRPAVVAAALLNQTRTLQKARYLRRWARRLRAFGFSPEDAIVIAYGSFGIDMPIRQVGVEAVITNDLKLAANFGTRYEEIKARFAQMVRNLPEPYHTLMLPKVFTTIEVLTNP
jgi:hypothetical protein